MVNTISLPSNAISGNVPHFKHFVFSTKVVNKRDYGVITWVIDTGATNHSLFHAFVDFFY